MDRLNCKIDTKELDELYKLFHFEKVEESNDACVYLYYNGYFMSITIAYFTDHNENINKLRLKYEALGYSVKITYIESLEKAHNELFNTFLFVKNYYTKCNSEYINYIESQTSKLQKLNPSAVYNYIYSNFYFNNVLSQNENIVSSIAEKLKDDKATLIILEAAAAMGKTSTSYEILNYLIKDNSIPFIPLFIELTKNRSARIFRHVLDDEINRNFPGISRELIIHEIKLGKIVLLIDGFDELLSRKNDTANVKNDAQTMLSTLSELYDNNCKTRILLTSRKSSFIIGELFDKLIDNCFSNYQILIERYQIAKPTITQWLGEEKILLLSKKNIPLNSLENPVILAYLNNLSIETINSIKDSKSIIDEYFKMLLEREQERQDLKLSLSEQLSFFTKLASHFVQLEIISETPDFIRDIITSIIKPDLQYYLSQYNEIETKPTEDEFISKLMHHALLDRVKPLSNNIGFVNDFIFGTFISASIVNGELQNLLDLISNNYIQLAIDAYSVETLDNKAILYNKIKDVVELLSINQQLSIELELTNSICKNYNGQFIDGVIFNNVKLIKNDFENCTFLNCIFDKCEIDINKFLDCTFIRCAFYNITLVGTISQNNLYFSYCSGAEIFNTENQSQPESSHSDYKKKVLENFWAPGKKDPEPGRSETALYRGCKPSDRSLVTSAIEDLIKEELIIYGYSCYQLNYSKMNEIRKILGR